MQNQTKHSVFNNIWRLSPDPVLQDPANALNYNRYSYVLLVPLSKAQSRNNPLKYTDPSGYQNARNKIAMTFVDFLDMVLDGNGSVIFSATWTSDGNGGGSGYTEMHENEEDAIDAHINYSMNKYGRTVLPMNTRAAYNYYTRNSNNVFAYRSDGLRFSRFGTASEKWFIKKFTYFELRNNPFIQEVGDPSGGGGGLTNNSNNTIYYKPDNNNDWDAIPLKPGASTSTGVDAVNVNGKVYKVRNGYNSLSINQSNKVIFDYPWYTPAWPRVEGKDINWMNERLYNSDGSFKYYEWPPGSGSYVRDTQWWNIFNPNNQIPDPRK